VRLGSGPSSVCGNAAGEALVHCLVERLAIVRAVTRVNPEQASKVVPWTPTRLTNGEGWYLSSKQPTHADDGVHRGTGSSTGERFSAQRGRSTLGERSRLSTSSWGPAADVDVGEVRSTEETG
jgi:hypothetical protein